MKKLFKHLQISVSLTLFALFTSASQAALTDISNVPLAGASDLGVLPNLMFIIDNSGSMHQDYTPDYISGLFGDDVDYRNCRDGGDNDGNNTVFSGVASGGSKILDLCVVGDPPFMTADINNQYYNPEIYYRPGVNANGVEKTSQTAPASVKTDGYGITNRTQLLQSATTININQYPDRLWCTTQAPTAAQLTDTNFCRKNADYTYPNATFKFGRSTGSPNQQVNATMLGQVLKATGAPYYYRVVPTEHCTDKTLSSCILSSVATATHPVAAKVRWCSDTNLTTCQLLKTDTFQYPRYIGVFSNAAAAAGVLTVTNANSGTTTVTSLKVNNIEIMGGTGVGCGNAVSTPASGSSGSTRRSALATAITNRINTCISNPEYTAVRSGSQITITSTVAAGAAGNGAIVISGNNNSSTFTIDSNAVGGSSAGLVTPPYTFTRVDINNSSATYPGSVNRFDCAARTTCTYTEELTNFSNWYSYYRTRMLTMKTAASQAFVNIDNKFRIGFIAIDQDYYLPIKKFSSGSATSQKEVWFDKLFAANPDDGSGTPLRSGLATAGRIYAGKNPVSGFTADPIEYACQQNFSLLTTDGYWNGGGGLDISGANIANLDGAINATTPREKYEGGTASSNSLADVAKYYYDTDLRTTGNCTGAISGVNVCDEIDANGVVNTAFTKQNMVTFTLGLGLDGERIYDPDYKTATTGDYAKIKAGTLSWPVPVQNSATAIDDLWHAAVNGEGTYFSAKDPQQLVKSLTETLRDVGARTGGGAAAALSSQKPIVGNNSSYSASYTSKKWTGNLEKYEIDLVTGNFNTTPAWCVEDVVNDSSCASPNTVEAETVSGTTSYYCVDTTSTTASCSGANSTFSGTTCKTKLAEACTGVFKSQAARNILMATYTSTINVLDIFEDAKLTTDQKAYFGSANLATALSQWSTFTTDQQTTAASTNVVINYLRGAKGNEDSANNASQDRLFRKRDAILGDIVNSTPIYAGRTKASYSDPGFGPAGLTGSFSNLMASRVGTVYVGANDGMLHAFNETNGAERWAFVPTAVLPNIAKIADNNWETNHLNFVNGDGVINDICIAADCTTATGADWRTIYVGGLGSGGKGYYALDITDPDNPKLLWEFGATAEYAGDTSFDDDIGLSYGNPMVVKKEDGKWVVLLTSGYNNTTGSNAGKGFLYVVDAYTGEKISKIGTGSGTAADPSGLAKVSAFVDDSDINNTANYVYGGDLEGQVWRFSLTDETVLLLAELEDATGAKQPVTSAPAIGKRDNKRMVFVGTGRYLGINDLTNTQQQSFYAIEDDDETTTLSNYRSSGALVNKNLSVTSGIRAIGNTESIDWSNKRGWFVDYIDSGERQNLPADIVLGAVIVPTVVPSNAACTPGGYSYLNVFDFASGNPLASNPISLHFNSPIVGYNVMALSDGRVIVNVRTADGDTHSTKLDVTVTLSGFQKKRVIWRELTE